MKTIGLTGDAGSGKSTVARILAARGVAVIDADLVAREVVTPPSPVLTAIVECFGQQVLTPEGELDRSCLSDLVFNDSKAHRTLDRIVLPAIVENIKERIYRLGQQGVPVTVLDAPRLFETGLEHTVDEVWVVTADQEVKMARLYQRGVPSARAQQILATQLPQQEKVRRAHRVIDNNGSLTDLQARVIKAWTAFHPE